jgi:hypothetical protein
MKVAIENTTPIAKTAKLPAFVIFPCLKNIADTAVKYTRFNNTEYIIACIPT